MSNDFSHLNNTSLTLVTSVLFTMYLICQLESLLHTHRYFSCTFWLFSFVPVPWHKCNRRSWCYSRHHCSRTWGWCQSSLSSQVGFAISSIFFQITKFIFQFFHKRPDCLDPQHKEKNFITKWEIYNKQCHRSWQRKLLLFLWE